MSLSFYNTLTGKKEEFKSIDQTGKKVGLYTCGPTVYNYAHIGNLRAYVFADTLRRTLEYTGFEVQHVMNITDVGQLTSDADDGEDKMVRALNREGKPHTLEAMKEVALKYETAFFNDLKKLNIEMPSIAPRASEHIAEDIELIQKLEAKDVAYRTSDGIYYDISKFPAYGTRGGFKLGELQEGARVAVNTEKKNPRDFALWKFSKPAQTGADHTQNDAEKDTLGFNAPFGSGFPGWHIECSAMSRKYLGQPFDIHTGGIDHIPVHHQNEIAQSEMAYDTPLANVWMHSEFLNISNSTSAEDGSGVAKKMAKSGENFITLQTLIDKGIHPLAYRYYLLQAHYRSPITFSWGALEAAQKSLWTFLLKMNSSTVRIGQLDWSLKDWETRLETAISDDLNTSILIALMHEAAQNYNPKETARWELVNKVDKILGLGLYELGEELSKEMNAVPEDIKQLASTREEARKAKDFKKSDELREKITKEGFEVLDTDSGPIVRKKL
ncbi:MAG: cysteine--tRNA ligase [Candidatus Taylorbacteria bacterium CG11_big_fil_rev_8_21_14_0_20_46_11]|uniref:Cysteine--tRNA ligase n=1 Tax=Candidatus Taylorbacteria bacterium CG11_big_fil_rev_8_21_14_0_20_46_11 TaxID=1975025 RepID=A0A2H0KAD1_9BACT|nr:MAG: cysteine--tRNA ligase [Candidatus Taylorbacteria bacterium CG11_big_fil_rev_8_21_14_0_20_46_11]